MGEPLPLATVHQAVLEFLRDRDDVVLFGAQAVNAYVDTARVTQAIDLMSTRAKELAGELRDHLAERFHIALRVRTIDKGRGYRLFQVRKTGNRHLVDLRPVKQLPKSKRIGKVSVIAPAELIALKVIAYHTRRGQPKSGTDWRDIAELVLQFPNFKKEKGEVLEALKEKDVDDAVLDLWKELVTKEIRAESDN